MTCALFSKVKQRQNLMISTFQTYLIHPLFVCSAHLSDRDPFTSSAFLHKLAVFVLQYDIKPFLVLVLDVLCCEYVSILY